MSDGPFVNTDREIYRGPSRAECGDEDRFYADSIHVTEAGGIGINCGGYVIVRPLREWHRLAQNADYAVRIEDAADKVIAEAIGALDCRCSLKERQSGHLVGCYVPALDDAIQAYGAALAENPAVPPAIDGDAPSSQPVASPGPVGDIPLGVCGVEPMDYDAMTAAFRDWLDKTPRAGRVLNPAGEWFDAFAAGAQWRNINAQTSHSQYRSTNTPESPNRG